MALLVGLHALIEFHLHVLILYLSDFQNGPIDFDGLYLCKFGGFEGILIILEYGIWFVLILPVPALVFVVDVALVELAVRVYLVESQIDILYLVGGLSLLDLHESVVRTVQLLCLDALGMDQRGNFRQLLSDLAIGGLFLFCLEDLSDIETLIILDGFETDGEGIA